MKLYLLIFFSCLLTTTVVKGQSVDETQLWSKVELLNKGIFEDKDSLTLFTLVRDDVSYGHSGGNIENKNEFIQHAIHNSTVYKEVNTKRISLHITGNTAIVRHQLNAVQTDKDGKITPLHLSVLQVWLKEKKAWKLLGRQAVKVTE